MKLKNTNLQLKKTLGLFETSIYGIGIILGAGIYAIIGEGAGIAGNSLWISFIFAALIASFTGLSYAELSSMYPKAAAEYVYTKKAFNKESLSFMIGWVFIAAGIVSAATVSMAFAGYFSYLFGTEIIPIAVGLILILSLLNFIGIKESARVNLISTIIEVSGLVIIIVLGMNFIGSAGINYFEMPNGFHGLLAATALIFFAFIGFEDIANISEETKNARSVIPKALLISLVVSTILYILVSLSAVSIMDWQALASSNAPLTDVAVHAMGPSAILLISIIALFATGNTVLILLIAVSRVLYGVSKNKALPSIFSKIHLKRRTPYISIFTIMFLAMVATTLGKIKLVAELTNIGIFIIYLFVNLSLIVLRFRKPHVRREFMVPINIGKFPVLSFLGAVTCILMMFYFDVVIILMELVVLFSGLLFYKIINR
jgi:APA family basic amino acid/polyamine antiporter